jgi:hypothetical protein
MHNSDFARIRKSTKGKALAAVIIGLFILLIFCPQTTEPTGKDTTFFVEFSSSNTHAFLPPPIQIDGEACTLKGIGSGARRTISIPSKEILLQSCRLVSATSCDNGISLAHFSGIRGADFKIACQLLNLPPPSILS